MTKKKANSVIFCRQLTLMVMLVWLFSSALSASDFSLNFTPVLEKPSFGTCVTAGADCTIYGGDHLSGSSFEGNDGTFFVHEKVFIDDKYYFHVVLGVVGSGFVSEYYTEANNSVSATVNNTRSSARASAQFGGGNARMVLGTKNEYRISSSLGLGNNGLTELGTRLVGNALDPLGVTVDPSTGYKGYDLSGTGTNSPTNVVLRMIIKDVGFSLEVLKPFLNRKPRITQILGDSAMLSQFVVDMRSISYLELNRPATVVNRLVLLNPAMPVAGAGDFDMDLVQKSNVTAGQFLFSAGLGWLKAETNDDGTEPLLDNNGDYIWVDNPSGWDVNYSRFEVGAYSYKEGSGFDVYGVSWVSFFDSAQNAIACNTGYRTETSICQ